MTGIRIITLITAVAAIFSFPLNSKASETGIASEETPAIGETIEEKQVIITKVLNDGTTVSEVFDTDSISISDTGEVTRLDLPVQTPKRKEMSKLMLGAELGTSLDLSSTDLSTFNFEVLFGYRYNWVQLLGVQVGVHKSLGTRDSFIPICLVFRTPFRSKPSRFFFHFNAGYSFNTVASSAMFGDITAAIGGGINLAQRPKFQSNISLVVGFRHFNQRHQEVTQIGKENVGFAQISFGISI